MWLQMGWERRSAHFGTEPSCSHRTLLHTASRLQHAGGLWRFTAADFSDSSAWCGTKLTDPSIAPVPWAGRAELHFPPKERQFSGVTARFQASEVGPRFAKIYKQQLFVSSVSFHPERVAVSRGWFQSADSQPPAVLFYLRRLGLRMLWFCSEKTPLEIAAYLTRGCYLCSNNHLV